MRDVNERLRSDPGFAEAFRRAQDDYVRRRDAFHPLEDGGGVGGGPLDRVKCLHAHYAHHVVCRCNPVGDWIEGEVGGLLAPPPCVERD